MDYRETLAFLYSSLPMFHRVGAAAYKGNLDNTIEICRTLGDPQHNFKSIHIAGTNGKGSVSHMLASVLQQCGYKTGLFTSPHLKDYRERIKVNGEMITESEVADFVSKYKRIFTTVKPSFFEWTAALAFYYFAKEKVDYAVIETGLGGRLDSTNVIIPEICVITNISKDHADLLGHTIEKIAAEKAGIIKTKVPLVIGETQEEIKNVFTHYAGCAQSHIYLADQCYRMTGKNDAEKGYVQYLIQNLSITDSLHEHEIIEISSALSGNYQVKNIITVLKTIDILGTSANHLNPLFVCEGIKNTVKNTGLQGRWQILGEQPLIICDTGHNEAGFREITQQIKQTPCERIHMVIGFVKDKNIDGMLKLLPLEADYYFCKAAVPRAMEVNEIMRMAEKAGLHGKPYNSVSLALSAAKTMAGINDLIFVGGSTFVVAEVL